MYKLVTVEDTVRVPPKRFGEELNSVIKSELNEHISGRVEKSLGVILTVTDVREVREGRVILGDGAAYYDAVFDLLVYQPVMHEVISGIVSEITEFGAFVNFGPIDGLIHVSQITEDYMGYDPKNHMFVGKESSRKLKQEDRIRARIVTISMKDRVSTSKIGLTMRQPYLGKMEWLEAEKKEAAEKSKVAKKTEKKPKGDKK